tara:strand:- start:122 stop:754 length:633 start_codon:yes stop_codon:yes gene_type:complete
MIIDDRVYFIHIPRTGGRYLRELLSNNYNTKYEYTYTIRNRQHLTHAHWHYPLYLKRQKEMNKGSKFFAVIRDPFEKMMSQLKVQIRRDNNIINKLNNRDYFFDYVEEHRNIYSFPNNWYRPQIDFISQETFLWHFSLGFENQFFSWLEKSLKLKIKNKEIQDYDKSPNSDGPLIIDSDLTAIKKNTYLYYEKDYLLSKSILDKLKAELQ